MALPPPHPVRWARVPSSLFRFTALALPLALLAPGCQSAPAPGATCTRASDCAAPLVCELGRCRAQCTAQRDCIAPYLCVLSSDGLGSCTLPDDPDCTRTGASCPAPLACVGARCVNLCEAVTDCPAGSVCVPTGDGRDTCVRDDVDAGAPIDAASSDAGADVAVGVDASLVDANVPPVVLVGKLVDGTGATVLGATSVQSFDGTVALVGDPALSTNAGAILAVAYDGASWSSSGALLAPLAAHSASLGSSMQLDRAGIRAIVGVPDDRVAEPGSLRVLLRMSAGWGEEQSLPLPDPTDDVLGEVAISGDGSHALAVYRRLVDVTPVAAIASYARTDITWTLEPTFDAPAGETDWTPMALDLSDDGTIALVGSQRAVSGGGTAFHVLVLERSGATWAVTDTLEPPSADDQSFGTRVALSAAGDRAFVTSFRTSGTSTCLPLHVFRREGQGWVLETTLADPSAGECAVQYAIAASAAGDRVLLTSHTLGDVLLFVRSGTSWYEGAPMSVPNLAGITSLSGDGYHAIGRSTVGDTQHGEMLDLSL